MARVRGIIAAGLASATTPTDRNRETTKRAERDAEAVRAAVDERVERSRATSQEGGATGDTLKSSLAGLGAASVFGGPAGLLIFGISQFLQGKRREGIAAYQAQAAESSEEFISRSEAALEHFESNATSDQERAEAEMMRAQWDQLRPLMNHPSAEVAGRAVLEGQALTGTLDETMDDWQGERLAAEQVERDEFANEIGRADGIRDDVFREGATFRVRQDAYERMLAVEDTAAGDQVLLVNAFKMVDPNSAVLPGEAATAANTAGVPDALVTLYNRALRDGERLDPNQRADLIRQAGLQYQVARGDQVDRNTDAIERARAQGVRDQLLPHITIPVKDQEELPFPTTNIRDATLREVLNPTAPADLSDVTPQADATGGDVVQDETFGQGAGRAASVLATETGDLFDDILVGFRGGEKFVGEDGNTYARFPDGTVERARADTKSFSSPWELFQANRRAKEDAERQTHNRRIRQDRERLGANPETGTFPIERRRAVNE